MSTGRNDPCPCGSGLKYKKCCINKQGKRPVYYTLLLVFGGVILLVSTLNRAVDQNKFGLKSINITIRHSK
jgi:hypothetical protein